MGDSSPANPTEMSDRKPSWPKLSLFVSVLLWLLAWQAIIWFVPIQPCLVIRADNEEMETYETLMGLSPDGKTLVTTVRRDPNLPGIIYHLWDARTGEDSGMIGNEETNLLPNVVYASQRNLLDEIIFPFTGAESFSSVSKVVGLVKSVAFRH